MKTNDHKAGQRPAKGGMSTEHAYIVWHEAQRLEGAIDHDRVRRSEQTYAALVREGWLVPARQGGSDTPS